MKFVGTKLRGTVAVAVRTGHSGPASLLSSLVGIRGNLPTVVARDYLYWVPFASAADSACGREGMIRSSQISGRSSLKAAQEEVPVVPVLGSAGTSIINCCVASQNLARQAQREKKVHLPLADAEVPLCLPTLVRTSISRPDQDCRKRKMTEALKHRLESGCNQH